MADSEFERFKKMFPGGKKDMKIMAIPSPLPGPGGIGRALIGRGVQSGIRRFGDVTKGDKTTQMKTRQGLERKDPMEPRVVPSGRSPALEKARAGGGGVTQMKDRRGLEIKKTERKAEAPPSRGFNNRSAKAAVVPAGSNAKPTDFEKAYQSIGRASQRPVRERQQLVPTRVKARPADLKDSYKKPEKKKAEKRKPERKSKVRIAFEKEFAAARKAGKKKFSSKLGKYGTYSTKLK